MTSSTKRIVNFVIIFLIGFAVGLGSHRLIFSRHFGPGGKGPLEFFSRKLSLNDEQREKVREIFKVHRPQIEASHQAAFENFEKIRKEIHAQILLVLTPEQQKKFEELHAKMEEHRKKHRGFGPPPWGHGPKGEENLD